MNANEANFIVHQVTAQLPFTLEVIYEAASFVDRPSQPLTAKTFTAEMEQHLRSFNERFDHVFQPITAQFDEKHVHFAKAALSNMIGGIGYFHGQSLVRSARNSNDEVLEYWPASLFTAVPSRSFFPRGFLWDEGFHNILISKWNVEISMDIVAHWLDLMNVDGWIPREQILGEEARARVPDEFVVQHSSNANPPTFFLPLQTIVKRLIEDDSAKSRAYLQKVYPRLRKWYDWYNTTQLGSQPFTYRWHGRDPNAKRELNPKTLTSGLDDYPRASHPTDDEYHVDLRCWMALASGVMADVARALGEPWQEYEATRKVLSDNKLLDELHWSASHQRYSDYGLHTDAVKLERPPRPAVKPGQRPPPPADKERVTKREPVKGFVDKTFGYVSLFPFLVRIIRPDSPKLDRILTDIRDPDLLWTNFGLRSLAKNSPLYAKHNTEHDPPYWRGYIWININYMAVSALHHYANEPGPYQTKAVGLYQELRRNLIENVFKQFETTGFIWENYDDVTGKGRGCHPFTGWSALVVAMMAEEY